MLKTVICDDETPALELLTSLLQETGLVEIVAACQTSAQALEIINRGGVELAFFDIEMPELTGVDAARAITIEPKPLIVFATAHAEYALEAFGIDAIDYILKPLDRHRVLKAVEKASRLNRLIGVNLDGQTAQDADDDDREGPDAGETLRILDAGRYYVIPFDQIIWIEAAGDYSLLHWERGELAIRRTLTSLEKELPATTFRRVHRSTIISTRHITQVKRLGKGEAEVTLSDGAQVRTSRSHRNVIADIIG